ncbi:MAG: isoprenyl transferase [Elusimicrobiota bacterium]
MSRKDSREENIPSHVAIIMDGNRRWARGKGFPPAYGHKKGVETVKKIVQAARLAGVRYLTLYAFSCENWQRSSIEVKTLMFLLKKAIEEYSPELVQNDISLKFSGRLSALPADVRKVLAAAQEKLKGNKSMVLNIALNYGGRQEIVDAVNAALASGVLRIEEKDINANLYTSPLPDPDLIIRTSGEQRISNFLLWQSAYSEFYFTEKFWPDFQEKDFIEALKDYSLRDRRKGA